MTTKDLIQLDTMIILHTENCNEARKIEKMHYLEKALDNSLPYKTYKNQVSQISLESNTNMHMRGSEHHGLDSRISKQTTISEISDLGNFVIFCNPNAGYYEFSCFDRSIIDFFLNREVNIFLWNYRGYGKSKGTASMKN